MEQIVTLAKWIREAKKVVVLTGAGMSTESGLPDFRSKGGWWRGIDPMTVATIDAFYDDYELFHEFYSARLDALKQFTYHEGHRVLSHLQQQGLIDCIATQNVDNFHTDAGSIDVYELHGNLRAIRCHQCHKSYTVDAFLKKDACSCGGKLRPGVVLFGEFLPEDAWQGAFNAISKADVVIVIGTSLQVSPVNQLPSLTKGKRVYINMDTTTTSGFDLVIEGSAKNILLQLEKELSA